MSNGHGDMTYAERQGVGFNHAEVLFKDWAERNGFPYWRIGFDEKEGFIPLFPKLNKVIAKLPDYVVQVSDMLLVMNVKGTDKFKDEEVALLDFYDKHYDADGAHFCFGFFFSGKEPEILDSEQVWELYHDSTEFGEFESDGKKWKCLGLRERAKPIEEEKILLPDGF